MARDLKTEPGGRMKKTGSDFQWRCQDKRVLRIGDMETRHIFNCVRMLWNHHVPEHMQLKPFKRYVIRMRRGYIIGAMYAMLQELLTRKLIPKSVIFNG